MRSLLMMLSLAVVLGVVACGKGASSVDRYTVKGKIAAMPAGEQSKEIDIHHERIPTYKLQSGEVKGMQSMVMTFAPTAGVSLTGFAVGDPVELTFEVHWDAPPYLRLITLVKLPPDTKLALE